MLTGWAGEGLLSADEGERIEAAEARAEAGRPRPQGPTIGEALGDVGAGLIVAALTVLITRSWSHLDLAARLGLTGTASLALLAAGLVAARGIDGAAGARLRSVLWAAATALAFATWLLVFGGQGLGWGDHDAVLAAAALVTPEALLLWRRSPAPPQHLAALASLAVCAGAAADHLALPLGHEAALGVFVVGAAWVTLALADRVHPAGLAEFAGSAVMVVSAQTVSEPRWGAVFALVVAAVVVAIAVWRHSLFLLAVGAYGVLAGVIAVMDRFFHGSTGIALGLMVAGLALIGCGLAITRRSRG